MVGYIMSMKRKQRTNLKARYYTVKENKSLSSYLTKLILNINNNDL